MADSYFIMVFDSHCFNLSSERFCGVTVLITHCAVSGLRTSPVSSEPLYVAHEFCHRGAALPLWRWLAACSSCNVGLRESLPQELRPVQN